MVRMLCILVFHLISANIGCSYAANSSLDRLSEQFAKFQVQLDSIEAKLTTLQDTINTKLITGDSIWSIRDIREAIKNHKFQYAERKLKQLHDKNHIANIVKELQADSKANIDIIMDFAKSLSDADTQLRVNEALLDEVVSSKKADPYKLIELIGVQRRAILRQKNITPEKKAKSQSVIDAAMEQLKFIATTTLKTAMMTEHYSKNVDAVNLSSAIYNFSPDLSNEVIEQVVDSVFGVVTAGDIIVNIASHSHILQAITGLKAIFYRLNNADNLNNNAIIILAYCLVQLQVRDDYEDISQDLKDDITNIIERLPTCARNLFFHSNVCLWNRGLGEYLYASGSTYEDKGRLRKIFTWYTDDVPTGGIWYPGVNEGGISIKNEAHSDELLYASRKEFNKDSRYVFTTAPKDKSLDQFTWMIELDGDYCYVKSKQFDEYLFASTIRNDKMNRYVFTWKPGTLVKRPEFQWQIRNCGTTIDD